MATYLDRNGPLTVLRRTLQEFVSGQTDRVVSTDNTGYVSPGLVRQPGGKVTAQFSQSISSGAATALSWDSIQFADTGVFQSGSPTRLNAISEGIYLCGATIAFASNTTGHREIRLRRNGSELFGLVRSQAVGATHVVNICDAFRLLPGDYMECLAFQNSGNALGTVIAPGYAPTFWLYRISSYAG